MAGRGRCPALPRAAILLLCLLGLPANLHPQAMGQYSFTILPDGTPRYTQVLRWEGNPTVFYYEVSVVRADGTPIATSRVESPELSLNLSPGDYRYKIAIYNVLRKLAAELPWQEFTILKARIPRLTGIEPEVWFLEDGQPRLELSGDELVPGATVTMQSDSENSGSIPATAVDTTGGSGLSVVFPDTGIAAGQYSFRIVNPGGLSSTLRGALRVRHKLPAPGGLKPASVVLGADELRGMRSLQFSWDDVPEATHYLFRFYRGTDREPVIRVTLTHPSYSIADLSTLDRGTYRWTVEAVAKEGERVVIPAAGAADAEFSIRLPKLVAPKLTNGETFYGW